MDPFENDAKRHAAQCAADLKRRGLVAADADDSAIATLLARSFGAALGDGFRAGWQEACDIAKLGRRRRTRRRRVTKAADEGAAA